MRLRSASCLQLSRSRSVRLCVLVPSSSLPRAPAPPSLSLADSPGRSAVSRDQSHPALSPPRASRRPPRKPRLQSSFCLLRRRLVPVLVLVLLPLPARPPACPVTLSPQSFCRPLPSRLFSRVRRPFPSSALPGFRVCSVKSVRECACVCVLVNRI